MLFPTAVAEPVDQNQEDEEELARKLRDGVDALNYTLKPEDRSFLNLLRPAQMRDLLGRLTALAACEAGKTTREAAEISSVSMPTMFRIKRTWADKENRSLKSISGFAGRKRRGASSSERFEQARLVAQTLLTHGRGPRSVHDFADSIRRNSGGSISTKAAERIARDALSDKRLTAENLARAYGRDVIVDAVAVSLVVEGVDDPLQPEQTGNALAVLAVVVEKASGLILAAEVAREADAVRSQYRALVAANWFLSENNADALWSEPAQLHVTVGPKADGYGVQFASRLKKLVGEKQVKAVGPRRFGRATKQVLGSSLGPLKFLAGSTECGNIETAQVRAIGRGAVSLNKAREMVATIVHQHNRALLDRLKQLGAIPSEKMAEYRGSISQGLELLLRDPYLKPAD